MIPNYLYKLVTPHVWKRIASLPVMDYNHLNDRRYIHLSGDLEQIQWVYDHTFDHEDQMKLLVLDSTLLRKDRLTPIHKVDGFNPFYRYDHSLSRQQILQVIHLDM